MIPTQVLILMRRTLLAELVDVVLARLEHAAIPLLLALSLIPILVLDLAQVRQFLPAIVVPILIIIQNVMVPKHQLVPVLQLPPAQLVIAQVARLGMVLLVRPLARLLNAVPAQPIIVLILLVLGVVIRW